jgi:DNA-binding transcriptional ArsR family regulator
VTKSLVQPGFFVFGLLRGARDWHQDLEQIRNNWQAALGGAIYNRCHGNRDDYHCGGERKKAMRDKEKHARRFRPGVEDKSAFGRLRTKLARRTDVSANAKLAYTLMIFKARDGDSVVVSAIWLSEAIGVSVCTARRALKELELIPLVAKQRRGKKLANVYYFVAPPWLAQSEPIAIELAEKVRHVIEWYSDTYYEFFGSYVTARPKAEHDMVATILEGATVDEFKAVAEDFLRTENKFFVERGRTITSLCSNYLAIRDVKKSASYGREEFQVSARRP